MKRQITIHDLLVILLLPPLLILTEIIKLIGGP